MHILGNAHVKTDMELHNCLSVGSAQLAPARLYIILFRKINSRHTKCALYLKEFFPLYLLIEFPKHV